MNRLSLLSLGTVVLFLSGCARDVFQIEIHPEGDEFVRSVTCWHDPADDSQEIQPLGTEALEELRAIYGSGKNIADGKKHRFEKRFRGYTPDDVGGAGSLSRWKTSLGSASYYVERFRGDDDLEIDLARRRQRADQLTDLIVGWAEAKLGRHSGFDGLREFLDEDVRKDLKNLAIYWWQAEAVSIYERGVQNEFIARSLQYLMERDYLKPRDIPGLYAVSDKRCRPLAELVQRLIVDKLGIEGPVPESLRWLSDPEQLQTSFDDYVATTEWYRERLTKWRDTHEGEADATPPSANEAVEELAGDLLFEFQASGVAVRVELSLATDTQPFATNGQWNSSTGKVTWKEDLAEHRALPAVCFATWSEPERQAQRRHFGQIVLHDGGLAEYALWYRSLPKERMKAWDRFLKTLSPGDKLKEALQRFRFEGEEPYNPSKPKDEQSPSLADTPRRLILKSLNE
jgi:hypothetical protein